MPANIPQVGRFGVAGGGPDPEVELIVGDVRDRDAAARTADRRAAELEDHVLAACRSEGHRSG